MRMVRISNFMHTHHMREQFALIGSTLIALLCQYKILRTGQLLHRAVADCANVTIRQLSTPRTCYQHHNTFLNAQLSTPPSFIQMRLLMYC